MIEETEDLIIATLETRTLTETIILSGTIAIMDTEIVTVKAEIGRDTEKEIAMAEGAGKEEITTTEVTRSDLVKWLLLIRAIWQVTVVIVLT